MARTYKPPMPVKRIKYSRIGRPVIAFAAPNIARHIGDQEDEVLTGAIGDMKASAPEERWAKTLNGNKTAFEFRLALGAPGRNLPGWFELDFLFSVRGVWHALEVDSAFTHRNKEYKDQLHDAWVLKELEYLGVFPKVHHLDAEQHLASQKLSDRTYKEMFP